MSETEVKMPSLGKPGEPCEQCGTPLDADQRYCLNCGKRRGGPRVSYQELGLGVPSPPAAAPEKAPAKNGDGGEEAVEKKTERDYAPLAAVGGIAVLGLMLLIGVLIGRGDGGSAPAPVVIPSATGNGASTETANGTGGGSQAGGSLTGGGGGGSKSGGNESEKAANERAREEAASEGAVEASSEDLEALESETGEQGAKNALNLPDKVATPGEPPPEDDKAPAGGEEGVTIK